MPMFASGRINEDLAKVLRTIDQAEIKQAVIARLEADFPHFRPVADRRIYGLNDGTVIALRCGRYLVSIRGRQVKVNVWRRKLGDAPIIRQLETAVTETLVGLAWMAVQRRVIRVLINAGYEIERVHRDADGAIVAEVEL